MRHSERPQPGLGKAVRQMREKHGETQVELAAKAQIAGPTLSLIERGHANPTWATVRDLAAALGVSVADLAKAAERFEV